MIEIPEGMVPWDGSSKGPPENWDRNWKVYHRGGFYGSVNTESEYHWEHCDDNGDIIAYFPVKERRA